MSETLGKQAARERVWRTLEMHGAARFPGAKGRIPNFAGAEQAAVNLHDLPEWRRARAVKINPDAPQLPVRRMALREGKTVYVAVPRLRALACFLELDPQRLGARASAAATIRGAAELGRPLELEELPPIDLIVCGAVAVNGLGGRVGKGGGYSDLEYALLREHGLICEATPVLTTAHPLQIVPHALERKPHDLALDAVVTPQGVLRCAAGLARPRGLYWEYLDEEYLSAIPVLCRLAQARKH
jgi:5-formyltetrahydrofolate cyclo-ligase